jgi:uroporphyrinogen decarboxylase
VLGFAAAPWTLACYLVQGRSREGFPAAKAMLWNEPRAFRKLLEKIARATARYLRAQIAAGAAAVQLFDTWAGELDAPAYRDFELPATQLLIEELAPNDTPVILFSKASNHLLSSLLRTGASVLSVDWRMDLAELREKLGREKFGDRIAIQGNIDPSVLLASQGAIAGSVNEALRQTRGRGHILNLGHGILPETPVENALAFIRAGQSAPLENSSPAPRASAIADIPNPARLV